MSKMNRRNNRFLSDKLRYTKRTTTKREFSFIPIPLGRGERGDAASGEKEQTFTLSPPKWASSPRDTPRTSELRKKKKLHVDISLIEPISRLKLTASKPSAEQEDPTINLAALRAAEIQVQKQSTEGKDLPQEDPAQSRVKLARDPIRRTSDEKEPKRTLQNLANIQSEEKDEDLNVQDAQTNSNSTTKTKSTASKRSTKAQASSDNDSEKLGRKKRRNSASSKDSEPQRSKSGNQSSADNESANEVPKSSKVSSNKNSASKSHRSRSGSRSSGLEEFVNEVPKSSKIDSYKNSGLKSRGSRRSSRSSVVEDSENEVPKTSRVDSYKNAGLEALESRRSSRSSVVEDSENEVRKSSKVNSYKNSSLKSRKSRSGSRSSVVEDSEDEVPKITSYKNSKVSKESGGSASEGFSSQGKRSKNRDEVGTVSDEQGSKERRVSRRSRESSAGSAKSSDVDHLSKGERIRSKSSDSEKKSGDEIRSRKKKSIEVLRKFEDLVAASLPALKKTRKSSGSEKSADERMSRNRTKSESGKSSGNDLPDIEAKSGSSGKSATRGFKTGKKPAARSSSSEKPAADGLATGKKRSRRSSSLEKSPRVQAIGKKPITRSSSSEISPGEGPSTRKISHKNIPLESSGERPSKSRKVHPIFQVKPNRSKYSRRSMSEKFARQPVDMDSSSDDQLFSPQKLKSSKQQIGSKKGALFKKAVESKLKNTFQSSGLDASSDEQLFSPQKRKVPDQQISSEDGEKSETNLMKPNKSDKNQLPKSFKDVSGEMSEEIPLQDKPLITTFAGLPLSDDEKLSTDENPDDLERERLEENIMNLEDILDLRKEKFDRSYDTSRGLKLNMLQPTEASRKRPARSVTDLDVLWDFLGKSLRVVIRGTVDEEKRMPLHAMKSFLEEHFLSAMNVQIKKKDMETVLKEKSDEIKLLTNRLLYYKQKNRLLAQKIYEKKKVKSSGKEDAVLDRFENFCQTFTQFKRN